MEAGTFPTDCPLGVEETSTTSYEDHGRIFNESILHEFTKSPFESDSDVSVSWTVVACEQVPSLTLAVRLDRNKQLARYVEVIYLQNSFSTTV